MKKSIPPVAKRQPEVTAWHGFENTDDYAWLRDKNWQNLIRDPDLLDPNIRSHLEAENAYTDSVLAPLKNDIETLYAEMKERIKEDDVSAPKPHGNWLYYSRFRKGGEHRIYCRSPVDGGKEQILFDGDLASEGKYYFKLGAFEHSPNHAYAAYAVDYNGSEIYSIQFRDLSTGEDLTDTLENTNGNLAWFKDSNTILYTVLDDNHRPHAVRRHRLGANPKDDHWVYKEKDPGFFVGVSNLENRQYLVICTHDHQTSETYLISAESPNYPPHLVAPREVGMEYYLSGQGDRFLILTNADGAEDFKIMSAPLDSPERENWMGVLEHTPGRLILSVNSYSEYWVRMEYVDALPRIIITDRHNLEHAITFNEDAYALTLHKSLEFDTSTVRFSYSSMTTPEQVFDYNMSSRERSLRKEQEVPCGHDPSSYLARRLNFPAPDGELIPVTLLYRKDIVFDGKSPVLLYGYGAYGISVPAAFNTSRFSLVDRGFVYAIAHVRGGREKGYRWYKCGRMDNKKNTFTDFIAAADGLIAEGMTTAGRIAAHGGSAGGMLVGNIANLRPELFGVILADVPFVDVLNTMLDDTLPLTPPEWLEWGNPREFSGAYDYIRSYSPYENVTTKDYPNIFVTAGLTDPRVTYWEPAKWVAKLRQFKTDDNTICLKTNMDAGHGGASGRFERLKETAELYAFLLSVI